MTLAPFWILYRDGPGDVDPVTRRHEAEHLAQARRTGLGHFYAPYLWDCVRGLVRTGSLDTAYRDIRWEVEARRAQHDPRWPAECADLPEVVPDAADQTARASINPR